ncbi:hypothetical protein BO83DRAFT_382497 [Aspergillus eucalypticola CBS 122712]|uniref:Aminoglycoside phosphotransferase domain-containing protein n=1 Tax=Aspergillus eucalypticola (strain CBS 122712 / IBT 29274) TaxID=1448314 RepID=A0A317URC3_ASPEC|nr:uncharacterized protein BO83DRAFT_382497 [Aspergillus eucalypticola CBS 122712]PWY63638.1 hypothetical protein BO83DRAFT_382497 [Aspergillus eucalypticola CBS 122712]
MPLTFLARYPQLQRSMQHPTYPRSMEAEESLRSETSLVVKFGKGVDLIEGENMLFVQGNTSIRVPRVYTLYSDPYTGKNYIVMGKMPGQTLLSLWPQLSPSEKEIIVTTLYNYFNELRSLPPPDYYGSLGG